MGRLRVDDSGREIYFEHYRGEGVPVLLIHGWGMSGRVWDGLTRALVGAGHAVVTFDQRGCGNSDKDFTDFSIAASVADAERLLAALGIDRVVVNGWSLGGAIAVETAARLGARCRGVVLTCAASPRYERSDDFPYGAPPGAVAETLAVLDGDRWAFFHGLAQGVCASDPGPGVVEGLASIFKQTGPLVGDALAELATLDQRQRMAELDVPVLNVVGGKDAIVDPGIGRAAMEFLRKGRLCEFPECGHAPFLEAFPRYRDELLHFLADVE